MSEATTPPAQSASGNLLGVSSDTHGTAVIVTAVGEIDMATAPLLDRALDATDTDHPRPERVVVDMAKVTFLASAGMSVLTKHHYRCEEQGPALILVVSDRSTLRTLRITGLTDMLTIVPDLTTALA